MIKRAALTYSDISRIGPYLAALQAAGVEPVPISAESPRGMEGLDGLVLSGGIDLNPELYHQARHPEADQPNDARDNLEMDLLAEALIRDLPVLAICRGMQLFNVAFGGTLTQHIGALSVHRRYDTARALPVHAVDVAPGSRLADLVGDGWVAVNSRHHQAVADLGEGLVVSARAEDGAIEGVELPGKRFAIGVQWHPEDQAPVDPVQARLFSEFAKAL